MAKYFNETFSHATDSSRADSSGMTKRKKRGENDNVKSNFRPGF